ncbi:MAG: RnfABCDGE type electron transport complex subunit D [Clostridia bacterium]|nr:RnfABCDGE type electron transport complex subunit D [Clostridia bacterium]
MDKYVVSSAPFIHSGNDINKMFLYTGIALVIPGIFGVMFFGLPALFIILVAFFSCLLSEIFYNLFVAGKFIVKDFSFFVTAMTLALTMPYNAPLWIVALAGFVSIFGVKFAFGGLGKNKFNPSVIGRALAGILFATLSTDIFTFNYKDQIYTSLTAGGSNTITQLLTGQAVGGIGTTCIIAILICCAFLIYAEVIDYKIPILAVLSYFVVAVIFDGLDLGFMNLCSGSFVFVSVFMLTDPNTSPNTFFGKVIYSVLYGGLCALLWHFKFLGENTAFAVLIFMDLLVPFMDHYLIVKPSKLGGYRHAHKN